MSTIFIFDQAEYPGGSIARAVDLSMTMPQHRFVIATYHPLSKLYHRTPSENIRPLRLYSFYNYQKKYQHTQVLHRITKNKLLRKIGEKCLAVIDRLNELSLMAQTLGRLGKTPIDIVQANAGIHFLPYRLALAKKSGLIYYFRHMDDYSWATEQMLQRASHFIFVGKNLMQRHRLKLKVPDDKCRVIYSPFDSTARLRDLTPGDLSFLDELQRKNRFIILMAARICADKGQMVALEAIHKLFRRFPQIMLLLAGEEDKAYTDLLREKISELQLEEHVRFIGHRADIPHILTRVDLALQAPLWFEALGGSIIEAMQLGVLTISADSGGPSEAIQHNKTGFLFSPGNSDQLAQLLEEILQQKQDYQTIRDAGKIYTNLHWSPQSIHNAMIDVYAKALNAAH